MWNRLRQVRSRLRALLRSTAVERDLHDEIDAHIDALAAEYRDAGLDANEALAAARRAFGGTAQIFEDCREVHRMSWLTNLFRDGAFGIRLLRRSPSFAVAGTLTLALGIGANTAIYSAIRGVLLRPVPVDALDRLIVLWETDRSTGTMREPASVPDYLDYRERARTLDGVTAFMAGEANMTPLSGDPERLASLRVAHDMLPMLGIRPLAGRELLAEDDKPGGPRVALVSESLARRLHGAAPAAVGRELVLDEQPYTIVGVVQDTTDFGVLQILSAAAYSRSFADRGVAARVDVWTPLRPNPETLPRETHPIFILGRLAPGVSRDAAQAEAASISADLERVYPVNQARGANVELLSDVVFGPVRPVLFLLAGAVFVVLLIACLNVANLLLARGASRSREVAVRAAIGAGPTRLLRQFLTESIAFTCIAGGAGLFVAYTIINALRALAPADVPRLSAVSLDGGVLGAALVIGAAVAITFGLIPTVQARRLDLSSALKDDGGTRSTGDRERARMRRTLVVVELAAAVMLLSGAGLLIRSFWNLQHIDPGFHPEGVLKAEYQLPGSRYPGLRQTWPNWVEHHAFSHALLARAAALPGVSHAAIAGNHPLDPGFTNSFRIVGREQELENWPEISVRPVSPGYFETVQLPLLSGRGFSEADSATSAAVAIVNQATVARFFKDRDPIGETIRFWGIPRTIVGVVGNEKFQGLSGVAPIAVYVSLFQAPSQGGAGVLLVRTAANPGTLTNAVRGIFRAQDSRLAVFGLEPLDDTVSRSLSQRRFATLLVSAFAGVALLLAAIGVYGVCNYDVELRQREIGIRAALGAQRAAIVQMVLGQALGLVGIALLLGVAAAMGLTSALSTLLFGIGARDPLTIGGVAALLAVVGLMASALPAWRASRTEPAHTLRGD